LHQPIADIDAEDVAHRRTNVSRHLLDRHTGGAVGTLLDRVALGAHRLRQRTVVRRAEAHAARVGEPGAATPEGTAVLRRLGRFDTVVRRRLERGGRGERALDIAVRYADRQQVLDRGVPVADGRLAAERGDMAMLDRRQRRCLLQFGPGVFGDCGGQHAAQRSARRLDPTHHLEAWRAYEDLATGQALGERACRCGQVDRSRARHLEGRQARPVPPGRRGDFGARRFSGGGSARGFSDCGRAVGVTGERPFHQEPGPLISLLMSPMALMNVRRNGCSIARIDSSGQWK
jgi:hypothetical protein